ncbi:ATP-binding protein [Microvirga sp. TS319]|uniref:ATP-binding protein n=1 Tax=Microvirga sp. TS319 TaxID=3241165 RepID=UPI00351A8A11
MAETTGHGAHVTELANDLGDLDKMVAAIEAFCEAHGVPSREAAQLCLVIEEIFTNIVTHGHDEPGGGVVEMRMAPGPLAVRVEIIDDGRPFNPLHAPPPDLDSGVEERPIGGLGVHFLRTMMSDIVYERSQGRNHLRFQKTYTARSKGA